MHVILPELLKSHIVTGIEIDHFGGNVSYKTFTQEGVKESRNLSKRLLKSSPMVYSDRYSLFLQFDAIVLIGTNQSLKVRENVAELVEQTKFLFVPVSIHNDIQDSELSLGYDSAINSIVESILKIRDTIDSVKYSKPRFFGVQVPGNVPNQMLRDITLAVEGYYLPHDFGPQEAKKLEEGLHACFHAGQTYSFVIFNESIQSDIQPDAMFSSLDVDWKVNKIDDSLCIGQSPAAMDRRLAVKLA
jgi:6-phosphofructokinase 1